MTTDNNTGISAEELREKVAGSAVSSSIIAAMLKEEIATNGVIQTCGMAPAGYFGVYGPGNSITERQLMDALPNPPEHLPKMASHFGMASGTPDNTPQYSTNFDNIIKLNRTS